ncbi:unnamed protein product [Linum tenue]|uniref:Prp31 C-terminal domain-containing protein n=1 Tax=Linum tenue TaxID=586396 RepID=A0AAV0IRN8_9ROSI|nr:unnamed protein product [Linum tenue]
MLGQAGRKARVAAQQSKPAAKKCRDRQFGSSGTTSGLTSSLAFALVQGIELSNPQAYAYQLRSGVQSTYLMIAGKSALVLLIKYLTSYNSYRITFSFYYLSFSYVSPFKNETIIV